MTTQTTGRSNADRLLAVRGSILHCLQDPGAGADADAVEYLEDGLLIVADGRVELDNNGVENAIRPTAVGKKNWLFIGAEEAGQRSAVLFTIIENCRRLGLNPYDYLRDVLTRLPKLTNHQTHTLTPAAWARERGPEPAQAEPPTLKLAS
jgi:hypothetical protein